MNPENFAMSISRGLGRGLGHADRRAKVARKYCVDILGFKGALNLTVLITGNAMRKNVFCRVKLPTQALVR